MVFSRCHSSHVGAQNNGEKKSFGNLALWYCKTWGIICCCFVHQHGRLVTWLKTIYSLTSSIIHKHSNIIYSLDRCKNVFKTLPSVAYRRCKNISDILIRAQLTEARFTLQTIFGTARVKLARVPKKSSANFVYTIPFLPYQKYRAKIFGPG